MLVCAVEVDELASDNDEGLSVTGEATQQAVDAAQQVDAARLCKAGYKPAGKLCVCAPGFGSYVPNWANESYPTLPPPCQYHNPGKDPAYNSSVTFKPPGKAKGKCFCFRCPVVYQVVSSGALCAPVVGAAAAAKLKSALMRAAKVPERSLVLFTGCAIAKASQAGQAAAAAAQWNVNISLTYYGRDARSRFAAVRGMMDAINAPQGMCQFKVCDAVKAASRGAAAVAGAAANTTKTFSDVCVPAKCDDRACQAGVCKAGTCTYTTLPDATACVDGPVPGRCRIGVCEGLKANIASASQGVTEEVIFKARFANQGKQVFLQGLGDNGNSSSSSNSSSSRLADQVGILYDDGGREHDDRYAGDGLYSNVVYIQFKKTVQAVYKEFYVSLLEQIVSSTVEIAAITTDYDTLLQVFPTKKLVESAQQKLEQLLDGGASPESATQQVYDLLLQLNKGTRSTPAAAAAAASFQVAQGSPVQSNRSLQAVNITELIAKVDPASVRRVSERRVEFSTVDGFPCMVLATADYSASVLGGSNCAYGDESSEIAALFQRQGYSVTFRCNNITVCPEGPPSLEDFIGWSKYAFVAVITIGDADASGEEPIILARAPTDFSDERMRDWQAGRMVLTGNGLFALRPSWFEKYRNDPASSTPARTVVYLAADRSAVTAGSFQEQQLRGFVSAFYGMRGSASYAGYDGCLSHNFNTTTPAEPSPGVALAKHLLQGGVVNSYPGTGAVDKVTGARFKSYTFRFNSTLQDQCALRCSGVECPQPPACAAKEQLCSSLTGTCDTSCCDKADGEACVLRGRSSSCKNGKCMDLCKAPVCSAPPCQQLLQEDGSAVKTPILICHPNSGLCRTSNLADGTACTYQGGPGNCMSGNCTRVYTIHYLLSGPTSSFPSPVGSSPALAALQAAVRASMGLPPSYPLSSISIAIPRPPTRIISATASAATANFLPGVEGFLNPTEAAAATDANTKARLAGGLSSAVIRAGVADLPQGSLAASFGFQALPSPALFSPAQPFGPGMTAQECDENGNVKNPVGFQALPSPALFSPAEPLGPGLTAQECDENGNVKNPVEPFGQGLTAQECDENGNVKNPVDYCKLRQCGTGALCELAACESLTGACNVTTLANGAACANATHTGTCQARACEFNSCSTSPCSSQPHALSNSCMPLPGSSSQYNCSCESGWAWNGSAAACVKEAPATACTGSPCNSITAAINNSCVLVASGFDCSCTAGYEWNRTTTKCTLVFTACTSSPCNSITAAVNNSCVLAGSSFDCTCNAGYEWNWTTTKCTQIVTACTGSPCNSITFAVNNSCVLAGSGFDCACTAGYEWNRATTTCTRIDVCKQFDVCSGIPHALPGACFNTPTGYMCACSWGYVWNDVVKLCVDENGCLYSPCNTIQNAVPNSCSDVPAPGYGFNCQCQAGYKWDAATASCVGACVATPCTNTTCRVGYCAGAEFCNYTSVNEGQLCTPPVSRRALKRTVSIMVALMDPPTFPPNYPSTCQSGTCATCASCQAWCGSGLIPLVNKLGVIQACQSRSADCHSAYPIAVWGTVTDKVQCMALGSTCPSAYRIGLYKEYPGYEDEKLLALDCYAASDVPACGAGPAAASYPLPVSKRDGTLMGCVHSSVKYCPGAYRIHFLTVTASDGTFTLDRCSQAGTPAACEAPAIPLLSYSTPGYVYSTLSACIRAASGPVAGVTPTVRYTCPWVLSVIIADSVNPLQAPPSPAADIIKGCIGLTLDMNVELPGSILCYQDVPSRPFTLISAGIPDFSGPVTYCVPDPGSITSCSEYTAKDSTVDGTFQLFDNTGTTIKGCSESTSGYCPWPYTIYFGRPGFKAKPFACQQGLPAGKNCADLYLEKYYQPVITGTPPSLDGCIRPCEDSTELMLYENRYGSSAELAQCGTKSPDACNAEYGVNDYVVLRDGAAATGGAKIGCMKYDTIPVVPGADQDCPEGFGFAWYRRPDSEGRLPVLKECWKTNGGNANCNTNFGLSIVEMGNVIANTIASGSPGPDQTILLGCTIDTFVVPDLGVTAYMQCPTAFRYFHASLDAPNSDKAVPATLPNPHSITAAACARQPPTCTGSFPGVPIVASLWANDTAAPILGCVSAASSLAGNMGCPIELPIRRSGTESEYQFWLAPGGPAVTGNNLVYKCLNNLIMAVGFNKCGDYTAAYHNGYIRGCFSQVTTQCPEESLAGFFGSINHPQLLDGDEITIDGKLACFTSAG
ncbi:hypothetical protein OEZ85_005135 [Tetradesmus obliquus]|uniref:EGF-like domain-containing protein n=1 Tax=Tetradesmus obliquus TaxID=3088 RepID=A0ABY8UHP6_TETOB|nr:hypothetical protein OEZ85_005135 [Tetradesmus obliquus]